MSEPWPNSVAPRVGAWIETKDASKLIDQQNKSHPVWVRGLKQVLHGFLGLLDRSHPVWVRGLKLSPLGNSFFFIFVAPRVGAWIETWPP